MMWLDRIQRSDGRFFIVGISGDGIETGIEIKEAYQHGLPAPHGCYLRSSTSFASWSRATARQYAAGYSISRGVTEHHVIYSFQCASTRVLLPSWVLQRDLFSPPSIIFNYLYTIYGLECLCYRKETETGYSVALTSIRDRAWLVKDAKHVLDRVTWFYSFPSANRAWKSVYTYASDGEIGLELPEADITYSVHGNLLGDTLFANRFRITTLRATEAPMEWAQSAPKEFRFDARSAREAKSRRLADRDLLRPDGTFAVSDREWLEIEPMMLKREYRTSDENRQLFNIILQKLAVGLPWSSISQLADGPSAKGAYFKLVHSIGWSDIRGVLSNQRKMGGSAEKTSIDPNSIKKPRFGGRSMDTGIPSRRFGIWTMSADEWKAIAPILLTPGSPGKGGAIREDHRLIVDSIIYKLATGRTWADVADTHGVPRTTLLRSYEILQREGQWAEIRAVLCDARTRSDAYLHRLESRHR